MTQTITLPPPVSKPGLLTGLWKDPEQRSVLIGIVGVILVHLILAIIAPWLFRSDRSHLAKRRPARPQTFQIEMPPETFVKPVPKIPLKFVQANPNANRTEPPKTNNFSDQNQKAAQEKPKPDQNSDMPATEGRKDIKSNAVVTGQLTKPQESVPPSPPEPSKVAAVAKPKAEQNPLSGFKKEAGDDPDGFKSNFGKVAASPKDVTVATTGSQNAPVIQNANVTQTEIDPRHPRSRPQLATIQTSSAVLSENNIGAHDSGITALDSRFNQYGVYLRRLFEAIEIEWHKLLAPMDTASFQGTQVDIIFRLDSKGHVTQFLKKEGTAPDSGASACSSAITIPAPYGEWSPEMIAVLGDHSDLEVVFYYLGG
jgi:hypothetical protein